MRPTVQLSIDLLETFATVIEHDGDAAQAARALDINQPSMSKRLAFLQHSNGLLKRPWLRRAGKTWLMTHEGRLILPVVHDLLRRYHSLHNYTNAPTTAPSDVLRFACGQTAGSFLVRRALHQFYKQHPNAQIRVSTMRAPERIAGVVGGSIDMALVGRDNEEIKDLARGTRLHIETLGRSGYCLACAKVSPWTAKFKKLPSRKPLPLATLAEFPLIVPEPETHPRQILDTLIHRKTWTRKVEYRIEIGGWLTILDCVHAGLGVGLVSELATAAPIANNLLFRPIADPRLGTMALKLITRAADHQDQQSTKPSLTKAWRNSLKMLMHA